MPIRSIAQALVAAACCSLIATPVHALTLEEAMALARSRGVEVLVAQVALADAQGALVGVGALLRDNPTIEAQGGPRYTVDGRWIPQASVGLTQQFELSDARGARLDMARAALERARADVQEQRRLAAAIVALAFVEAVGARDALLRAESARELAESLDAVMEARGRGGDASGLEVRRVRIAAAQARADVESARGTSSRATGELRALVGLPPVAPLELEGTLGDLAGLPVGPPASPPALARVRAAIEEAAAERRVGDAMALPQLGLGLFYQYEEGDHMGLLGLSITLPFFDHGQGVRARADGRRAALEQELDAREAALGAQRAAAQETLAAYRAALAQSARALVDVAELDAMARRSWEAGETSLTELLTIRAELAGASRAHSAREREAALTAVSLAAALGAL